MSVAWGQTLVCRWQLMDGGCGRAITEKPCRMLRAKAVNTLMAVRTPSALGTKYDAQ